MPKIVERLKRQLAAKGVNNARAVAVSQLQKHGVLQKGSADKLTPHGEKRNSMSAGERAKDRQSKYSGGKHQPSDYTYNKKTNRAKLKTK